MGGFGWELLGVFFAATAVLYVHAFRARDRREFGARVLGLAACATRRGLPLPPLLLKASREVPRRQGRALHEMAERLNEGEPLSLAIAKASGPVLARAAADAIAATEGGPGLPGVLRHLAREATAGVGLRYRVGLALVYPLLVGWLLLFLHGVTLSRWSGFRMWSFLAFHWPDLVAFGLPTLVGLYVLFRTPVGRLLRPSAWLPVPRVLGASRVLRLTAVLLREGTPLAAALRAAAPTAGGFRRTERIHDAADELDAGGATDEAWARAGLPAFAVHRLRVAGGDRLADVLDELSDECVARHARRGEALLRWIHPVAILLVGGLVFVEFRFVFGILESARAGVMPW